MAPMVHPINPFELEALGIELSLEYLTPALAEEYLTHRAPNRNIKRAVLLKYARDMRAGNWGIDGSPLVFNKKGQMINGQHRCGAVLETGVTIIVVVVRGIDDEEFVHMDTGRVRTMAEVFQVAGENAATTLASALRLLYLYNRELLALPIPPQPTHDELQAEFAVWPLMRDSLEVRSWCRNQISPSVAVFFHFLFSRVDAEKANVFMRQLGRLVVHSMAGVVSKTPYKHS